MLEKTRTLECKGVRVEMRLQGPSPEVHRPGAPFVYGHVGYCIFFPEQEYSLSRKYTEGICGRNREGCGSRCDASEDLIGNVGVSAKRVSDYPLKHLQMEFAERGLYGGDVVAEIGEFYPVHPLELRRKRIGGSVLDEVTKDCRRIGSAAVYCTTAERGMRGLLRSERFGFREIDDFPGEFIRAFE
jgi:hypothetical protein